MRRNDVIEVSSQHTHVEKEHVVGLDEAEHRAAEQHQQTGESAEIARVACEVRGGIDDNRDADDSNDQRHGECEPVETKVDVEVERGHPAETL
jgi:phosphoribosylformimino-5-aminoimidazole carboxamide ribonucleotide (ProFAR) isomerase